MCTVTVVRASAGVGGVSPAPLVRLVCNRDEQLARAASLGLATYRLGSVLAAKPLDPPSGGTWIGANEHGLVACLLNANPPARPAPSPAGASRGEIVPAMLTAGALPEALALLGGVDPRRYPPFRLIILDAERFLIAASDGDDIEIHGPAWLDEPIMLTSSGLGDHVVEAPRRDLFERSMFRAGDVLRAQAAFHAQRWPDRLPMSVLMSRPGARTVSRTCVDLHHDHIAMHHVLLDDALQCVSPSSVRLAVVPALTLA